MMTREESIKKVKELCGVEDTLTWAQLCKLTEFDSFATCFSFGFKWNDNCKDNLVENFTDQYLHMIIFNVSGFPKITKDASDE